MIFQSDLSKAKIHHLDHLEDFTLGFNEAGSFTAGLIVTSESVAFAKAAGGSSNGMFSFR